MRPQLSAVVCIFQEYSCRFNLHLPHSLHRQLVESADRDGGRLNQSVVALLLQGVRWRGCNAGWRPNRPRWPRAAE
ncbi:MAG: hypothetical protein DCC58_06730 [Chloroflexi bacterium]|nr:MAG: hypothetical protein DCC58_06730 [Chloroflexota bacterium]